MVLHNVTDGLTGPAPDLGALEIGAAPPHYGLARRLNESVPAARIIRQRAIRKLN